LLGDGARARNDFARRQVLQIGADDSEEIDARIFIEARVF